MKKFLFIIRLIPILLGVDWKNQLFVMDLNRWCDIYKYNGSKYQKLGFLMWKYPEFRNLFLYRHAPKKLYRYWVRLWYKPMDTLFIDTPKIGGGLFIQHGFATMIAANSIGENCWINQQVTVGYTGKGCPTIGNNVMITCGAKVLGNIYVADNSLIGANAVVVKDVEEGAVMGGVPAKRIR